MHVSPKDPTPLSSPPVTTGCTTDNVKNRESSKSPISNLQVAYVSTEYDSETIASLDQDEEGFLEHGFLGNYLHATISLVVVFLSVYQAKGESRPQGEQHVNNDIESDNNQSLSKKRKVTKFSKVYAEMGVSKEDARVITAKHNVVTHDNIRLRKSTPKIASSDNSFVNNMVAIKHFDVGVENKKKVEDILTMIDRSKCDDVLHRIFSLNPIVKVRCSKPKGERIIIVHLIRRDSKGEYSKKIHVSNLIRYGYSEWLEILVIIKSHKGIHAQELKLAIILMINEIRNLNLVPIPDASSMPIASFSARSGRRSQHSRFLLPYGTTYINNSLPVNVECIQHFFIKEPGHGLLCIDNNDHICIQWSIDLHKAPIEHLFHLRLGCKRKPEADCYHWIIYYKLDKRRDELACNDYRWIKPYIISDAEKGFFKILWNRF